jgi:hypothetical protein
MRSGIRRFLLVLFSIGLLGVLGCPRTQSVNTSTNAKPYQGQEFDLVAPASLNLPALWEVLIQEWSSQSGATARFKTYNGSTEELNQAVTVASGDGGVVFFPLNRLCEVERSLTPLRSQNGQFDSRDLFKGLRERILTRERQMIACPISTPVLVCYYRSDLLRAAKIDAPDTWDDYNELVSTVANWAPGLSAVEPLEPDFRATTFFAKTLAFCKHPENYSVWFDVDTGKPALNTAGFEKALEVAHKTWQKLPAETLEYGPADCRRLILSGNAAIALTFESSEADLSSTSSGGETKESPRIDGIKIGICRLPGSRTVYNRNSKKWDLMASKTVHAPALCGFAGLAAGAIAPKGRLEDAAPVNLLATLSTPSEFDRAFFTLPKSPSRESQLSQAPSWYGPDLSAEEASLYCDTVAQSLRDAQLVFELPLVGATEFRQAASEALEPLLRGNSDTRQALAVMQQKFEAIVDKLGADTVRNSYRRGLGLSPVVKR